MKIRIIINGETFMTYNPYSLIRCSNFFLNTTVLFNLNEWEPCDLVWILVGLPNMLAVCIKSIFLTFTTGEIDERGVEQPYRASEEYIVRMF